MKNYFLYGFVSTDINNVASALAHLPGTKFIVHESSYRGGVYYRSGTAGKEEFILQSNFNPLENEYAEPEFQNYATLLYIGPTERSEEITNWFDTEMNTKAALLRHRKI